MDEARLAGTRRANHDGERMAGDLIDEPSRDRVSTEEPGGVLVAERLQAAVWIGTPGHVWNRRTHRVA